MKRDTQHNGSVVLLGVIYADCRKQADNAESRNAECHYAGCHSTRDPH
jgi:hypothetical protein